jgi:hypothetical protein
MRLYPISAEVVEMKICQNTRQLQPLPSVFLCKYVSRLKHKAFIFVASCILYKGLTLLQYKPNTLQYCAL